MKAAIHIDRSKGARFTDIKPFPVDRLKLDPANVRFSHLGKRLTDKAMENLLWDEPETRVLLNSIIASGGLSNRPVVTREGVAKEGNRRTVCVRRIRQMILKGELRGFDKDAFKNIDCEILPDDITLGEIDLYLARVHVSGVKEWDALNQAGHIWHMYHVRKITLDKITEIVGMSKGKVFQRLKAFEWTKAFIAAHPDEGDIKKYSFFEELYKRPTLRHWAQEEPKNLQKFFEWVAEGKFDLAGAKDVRDLTEIFNHTRAMKAFQDFGMRKAMSALYDGRPELTSPTFEAVHTALESIRNIGRSEYKAIPKDPAKVRLLKSLHEELENAFQELKI